MQIVYGVSMSKARYPRLVAVDPDTLQETWQISDRQTLVKVHPAGACLGEECVLHKPTEHHMANWPLFWREDTGLFERTCSHGVGHPDPDQFAYWKEGGVFEWKAVHGCDGCCRPPDTEMFPIMDSLKRIVSNINAPGSSTRFRMEKFKTRMLHASEMGWSTSLDMWETSVVAELLQAVVVEEEEK